MKCVRHLGTLGYVNVVPKGYVYVFLSAYVRPNTTQSTAYIGFQRIYSASESDVV